MKFGHLLAAVLTLAAIPRSAEAQQLTGSKLNINSGQTDNSPIVQSVQTESYNIGQAFSIANLFQMNRIGGTGQREAVHIEMNSDGGQVNEFLVGLQANATVKTGSGSAFGLNQTCVIMPNAASSSQCIGMESNTDARRDVVAKVGAQFVDVDSSTGQGTAVDTGISISKQTNGAGWKRGIQLGYGDYTGAPNFEGQYPVKPGGSLLYSIPTGRVLATGIDFSKINQPFSDAAVKLAVGNQVKFGDNGEGGRFVSATAASGPSMIYGQDLLVVRKFDGSRDFLSANDDGIRTVGGFISPLQSPASNSACSTGKTVHDANFIYVCVATNTWKRSAQLQSY